MTNLTLKLANNATATFASNVAASDTTFSLSAGHGARFPALAGGDYFPLTAVKPSGEREIMYVTARSFDVLTVLRHQENTVPLDFLAGEIAECRLTAGAFLDAMGKLKVLVDTAISAFEPTVGVTTSSVLSALSGALTSDQFTDLLNARIGLIDASAAVPNSINARIKAETDARVQSVQTEIDARIAADQAEAGARTTYVQQYAYSKQGTTDAIAFQASVTQAAYVAYADAKKTEAISAAAADVRTYAYGKTTSDGALATQLTTVRAEYTAYADGKKNEAISAASADVRSYTYSQAQVNSAISASETTLRSEFAGGGAGYATQAYVQSYAYSVAQADAAIASQTSDLRSTVGTHTTAISTNTTSINGLTGQVYTKIDSNGYVTGYGLSSTNANGAPTSDFIIIAANFKIAAPGASPTTMFTVSAGTVGFSGLLKGPSGSFGTITIDSGGSVSSGQTGFGTGSGFWLDGTGRISLGNSATYLRYSPAGGLELKQASFTVSISGTLSTSTGNGTQAYGGSLTANITDGVAPFTCTWTTNATSDNGSAINYGLSGGQGTTNAFFIGTATNNSISASIYLVVTDSRGITASASTSHYVTHGTPL